jgi:hypothetical protein
MLQAMTLAVQPQAMALVVPVVEAKFTVLAKEGAKSMELDLFMVQVESLE